MADVLGSSRGCDCPYQLESLSPCKHICLTNVVKPELSLESGSPLIRLMLTPLNF